MIRNESSVIKTSACDYLAFTGSTPQCAEAMTHSFCERDCVACAQGAASVPDFFFLSAFTFLCSLTRDENILASSFLPDKLVHQAVSLSENDF